MTTWVLLRGLTRDARHWGGFPQALAAATGRPVQVLDLPGNGTLWREPSPWDVAAMVASARAQLQALGVPPPYRLLAMSLGAMVATDWAHRHPHELDGGVLVNTSMRPFSRFTQRLRPRVWPSLLALALRRADDPAWESTVLRLTSNTTPPDGLLPQWVAWRQAGPVSRANALRQLAAAARFRAPRAAPPVPMRVLASTRDGLVDPACSRALAQAWGCGFAEHPRAGHDLPLDDPDWVVAQAGIPFRRRRGQAQNLFSSPPEPFEADCASCQRRNSFNGAEMLYLKRNLPAWERAARLGGAAVMAGAAASPLLSGPLAWAAAGAAAMMAATALVGWCPACALIGRRLKE